MTFVLGDTREELLQPLQGDLLHSGQVCLQHLQKEGCAMISESKTVKEHHLNPPGSHHNQLLQTVPSHVQLGKLNVYKSLNWSKIQGNGNSSIIKW